MQLIVQYGYVSFGVSESALGIDLVWRVDVFLRIAKMAIQDKTKVSVCSTDIHIT